MLKLIKHHFIYRLDPYHAFLIQALRTLCSGLLGVVLYHVFYAFPEHYWIILSAAFIVQTRVGRFFWFKLLSVLACGLLAAFLSLLMVFSWHVIFISALLLGVLAYLFVSYRQKSEEAMIRGFFVLLFAIMSQGLPLMPDGSPWQRFSFVLLGTLCALTASFLFRENKARQFQQLLAIFEHNAASLIVMSLNMIGDKQYDEDNLHELRSRLLRHSRDLKKLGGKFHPTIEYANALRAFAIDLANLRFFNVSDKANIAKSLLQHFSNNLNQLSQWPKTFKASIVTADQAWVQHYAERFESVMTMREAVCE